MERHEILDMLGTLQLSGVRAAYDEIVPPGVKRQHSFERILGSLLKAEIAEKHARSIRYQMGIAKLPLAKEIEEFVFKGTPINAELVRDLGTGGFLEHQRNVVLIGGTGSGKSHLAIGIARNCIRGGAKARYFNVVDLVNKLEAEAKLGRQGRIADGITRVNLLVLDELGIDRGAFEDELLDLLGQGQLGNAHLVADRPGMLLGNLSLQELSLIHI